MKDILEFLGSSNFAGIVNLIIMVLAGIMLGVLKKYQIRLVIFLQKNISLTLPEIYKSKLTIERLVEKILKPYLETGSN
jgi:hypothetical protein